MYINPKAFSEYQKNKNNKTIVSSTFADEMRERYGMTKEQWENHLKTVNETRDPLDEIGTPISM